MSKSLCFIFLFISSILYSQEAQFGCLLIDFENAPELNLTEGSVLSNQYEAEFGLSFSLETGGFPLLAEVGAPLSAFYGSNGADTPATIDADFVGRYFLTDDGKVTNNDAPPIILDFSIPIDSFAGCILDLDFDEIFKIEAYDEFGSRILIDSITSSDSNAGDGLATCWGFNLDGCVGTVYRIKFSGYRTAGGGFGLGLDNLSFCYSGIDAEVEIKQPTCLDLQGSIKIINSLNQNYQYSLDGINFSSDANFTGLDPNDYEIFVRDENGCETSVIVTIAAAKDPVLINIDVIDTKCGENNGAINFNVTPDLNATFSLNGSNFTSEQFYENLEPGDYNIQVIDDNSCTGEFDFEILPSLQLMIEIDSILDEFCENNRGNNGNVSASAFNGTAPYSYSLNNGPFKNTGFFDGLGGGSYNMVVTDDQGCENNTSFFVEPYPFIELLQFPVLHPECILENGEIEVNVSGGFGELQYSIDSINFQNDSLFDDLKGGDYKIFIKDENDCQVDTLLSLNIPLCPIYIPNVISGNEDGINDDFIISVHPNYDVDILRYWIFDRWGERIFYSEDFFIREFNTSSEVKKIWWDGKFKGKFAVEGVYAYLIEVRHENGDEVFLSGTVTLLR